MITDGYCVTLFIGPYITRQYDTSAESKEHAARLAKEWARATYPDRSVRVYHVRYRPAHAAY